MFNIIVFIFKYNDFFVFGVLIVHSHISIYINKPFDDFAYTSALSSFGIFGNKIKKSSEIFSIFFFSVKLAKSLLKNQEYQ